jgi:hypothetical protein
MTGVRFRFSTGHYGITFGSASKTRFHGNRILQPDLLSELQKEAFHPGSRRPGQRAGKKPVLRPVQDLLPGD